MAEDSEAYSEGQSSESSSELKKKVVDHATEASVQAQDDPSRSSLHYGEDHDPETATTSENDAARSASELTLEAPDQQTDGQNETNGSQETAFDPQPTAPGNTAGGSAETSAAPPSPEDPQSDEDAAAASTHSSDVQSPTEAESIETSPNNDGTPNATAQTVPPNTEETPQTDAEAEPAADQSTEPTQDDTASDNAPPVSPEPESENTDGNAQGPTIGTLNLPDSDPQLQPTVTLSDDRFEVVEGDVKLKDGVSLDEENAEKLIVEATVTDSIGETTAQTFEVDVPELNSAPTAINMSSNSVDENAQGAVIGKLDVADVNTEDAHGFTLSDDRFEVVDGDVKLKDGITLDHEEAAQIALDVTATDSAGAEFTQSFEINVADLNEGPGGITLDVSSDNLIKNGSFEEFDLAKGRWKGFREDESGAWKDSNGIEVWDNLGGREASDGDQLMEMDHGRGIDSISQTVDTEEGQLYDLGMDLRERIAGGTDTVEVYWNGDLVGELNPDSSDWESFRMQVVGSGEDTLELREPANENDGYGALIDNISLVAAPATIAENVDGAVVGKVSFEDPDNGDSHSFSLSDERFEIADGMLRLKPGVALDHEEAWQIQVDITVKDQGGLSHTDSFSITVADMNEGPTNISLTSSGADENVEGAVIGTLDVTDADIGDTHAFTLSDDRFEVVDGTVRLKDGVALDHEEAAQITLDVTATDEAGADFTQSFQINVADLNEGPNGISLSSNTIAENAEGAVVGQLDVSDVDAGDTHSFTLSDDRFEVVDGTVKLKDGISLDHEDANQISLEVTATDSGGAEFTQSFEVNIADMPDVTIGTGFHASYFDVDHRLSKIDDIDWDSTPTHQELVDDINYTNSSKSFWEGGSKDTFGTKITGNIETEEGGTFNFHIGGDDGVVLFVDGVEVVENDGLHGFRTRSGEIELEPGTHVIEVRYFENYGHAGLKVEWEGPGIDGRELLSAPDVEELQTVNGMPLSLELNLEQMDASDGSYLHILEGMPEGTILQAGDNVAEVGGDGAIDISDWDVSMMTVTPPIEFIGQIDAQLTTQLVLDNGEVASSSMEIGISVDAAQFEPPNIEVQAGFHASYYDVDHKLREIDDIDWDSDPTHEEIVGDINYQNGRGSFWEDGSKDTFGAKISGEVTIEEGGSYDFFVGGDDGVVLYVNGVEVIDNDGLHGFRTRSGEIELEPGTHEIEVRYFENYGHAGLKLEWEGPDTNGRELVQADTDLRVAENGALELQLEAGASDTVSISGLPDNTILISGDDSAVASGSEIDVSGWNLDLIEFMPPSGFVGEIEATVSVSGKAFNGDSFGTQQEFTISVGDFDTAENSSADGDDMLMATASDDAGGANGWSDENYADDDDVGEQDDDAMEESVEMTQDSEQSNENFDTYERQDW